MLEHLLDECGHRGLLDHVCPDFECELSMARHLVGLLYNAGFVNRGDFWRKALNVGV